MPRLWTVRDKGSATSGTGTPISFAEISGAFGSYSVLFLAEEPAPFNVAPSRFPSLALIEVSREETAPPLFARAGFYVLDGLSVQAADELLSKYRKK